MDVEKFASFIQTRRREQGMTQAQLAQKLNVTTKAVSRWERAVGFPDIQTLQPLADALEVTITELMQSRRLTSAQREQLSVNTVELIREQEVLSRRRRMILNAGRAVIIAVLLFLLIQVRRVKWVENWLPHVVRGLLVVGGFCFARMWEYILERGWLRDRPFGIWHSRVTWVWAPMAFAGAMLVAHSWSFGKLGYILSVIGGLALIVGALYYYGKHEYDE